ncbi:hypothetical protein F2P81_009147 [Scophthalmus maximus]|uniref:Uncharacterized protein n=1 Tax=Scophthalmus maximus TaxID=52904 RepID=A0A6A4SXZ6_SCOMX|nr:hypothetical protein F2P81_009147 [Scophthalmus maximus]
MSIKDAFVSSVHVILSYKESSRRGMSIKGIQVMFKVFVQRPKDESLRPETDSCGLAHPGVQFTGSSFIPLGINILVFRNNPSTLAEFSAFAVQLSALLFRLDDVAST